MQESLPRYEFRVFAQNFGLVEEKIRTLSKLDNFRESSEDYIISKGNSTKNIKVRYNLLDIKIFVKEEKGLQQWTPGTRAEFPVKMEVIRDELFHDLGVTVPEFQRAEYSLEEFFKELIRPHQEISLIRVLKRRFGYRINNCISEIAELLINGAAIKTLALESINVDEVLKAKEILGLQEYENVNYLLAIKRILGMEALTE